MKPTILDLYAGAGGSARGYQQAGFRVVGVDLHPQPNYIGEDLICGDALQTMRWLLDDREPRYSLSDFSGVHASPPCQAHSTLKARTRHIDHPELIGPTRELLQATGLPYVIENVPGAPLINPVQLCGSAFGLDVRRHRLFETNFPIMSPGCSHGSQAPRFEVFEHGEWRLSPTVPVYGVGGGKAKEHWATAMEISWMTHPELAQAIPPAFTRHVGSYLLSEVERRRTDPNETDLRDTAARGTGHQKKEPTDA